LPDVGDDKLPSMPMLNRNDTMDTLPLYTSRTGTPGDFELGSMDQKRPVPSRTGTTSSANTGISNFSYSSRQPLIGAAAELGRSNSPTPTLPSVDLNNFPPTRTATSASNRSFGPGPQLNRAPTNGSGFGAGYTASPATYSSETMPSLPPPIRSPLTAQNSYRGPAPYPVEDRQGQNSGRSTYDDYFSGRASPAPSVNSYGGGPLSPQGMGPGGYPSRSTTNPMAPRGPGPQYPLQRNMTAPIQHQHQPTTSSGSLRSVTSPMQPRPYHQPTSSNGSLRNANPPRQPHQYYQNSDGGDYDYFNRPPTSSSQRSGPRAPAYGNGWNQDVERGQGPRY
jgi:hypothetical protein